jgi:hypothetical protein
MRIKNIEFGLIRDHKGKIGFERPNIDRKCEEGCVIFTFGFFFVTILKGNCSEDL